ncbi:MAG: right-handed parallel beta-helix repeat-containing protein, partial [Eggerthellaceae bacterium]|nr:right-handed parallel beta-helix repeat-containing protein [Eggerthellaceae bacterium]
VRAAEGAFPEGARLEASLVADGAEQAKVESVVQAERAGGRHVAASYVIDVSVLDVDGAELQPADGAAVEVSFAAAEAADQNLTAGVYHVRETEGGALEAEALDVTEEGGGVTAATDGFSYYTVEFTYNDLQYVMEGDATVALADILAAVGLSGEPSAVSVSDPELFSAEEADGTWTVTVHRAFSSTEWMKVTIAGVEYQITVTDDDTTGTKLTNGGTLSAGTYYLDGNVTLTQKISVNSGEVVLNLNGHTLTGNGNDTVFSVTGGSLTVNGEGMITGGKGETNWENNSYRRGGAFAIRGGQVTVNNVTITGNEAHWGGGAIVAGGTFTMNNSTISGNTSVPYSTWNSGGAVFVQSDGTFIMNGGSITGNTSENGTFCGVDINSGTFKVSGNAVIANNTYNGQQKNFSGTVTVIGELTEGANIGVTHSPGVFTSSTGSVKASDYQDRFTSDDPNYSVVVEGNELKLGAPRHNWSYTANENVITATCNHQGGTCSVGKQTVTLNAEGKAYDGAPVVATCVKSSGWTTANELAEPGAITYSPADPTNAGTYTASVSVGDATATKSFTIAKAPAPELTDPQKPKAREGLTYTGEQQELVTAPDEEAPAGYTVKYSLDGETWSDEIPVGTDAGSYTVKVRYEGDSNHETFDGEGIAVTIAPKPTYSCTSGDGASWTKGSSDPLTFTFKRSVDDGKTYKAFKGAKVDGADVPESAYATAEGSLVLSMTTTYLETLSAGEHELTAVFEDGEATAKFTVNDAKTRPAAAASSDSSSPKTGDALPVATLAACAALGAATMLVSRSRIRKPAHAGKHARR